jgi:hypothetical protein
MRKLSMQELEDAFLCPDVDKMSLSTVFVIINRARHERGIDIRQALQRIRYQAFDVSIFLEKIVKTDDLDDVVHVIEMLEAENINGNLFFPGSLRLLQSWRAKTLMQIVIEKQKAMNLVVVDESQGIA